MQRRIDAGRAVLHLVAGQRLAVDAIGVDRRPNWLAQSDTALSRSVVSDRIADLPVGAGVGVGGRGDALLDRGPQDEGAHRGCPAPRRVCPRPRQSQSLDRLGARRALVERQVVERIDGRLAHRCRLSSSSRLGIGRGGSAASPAPRGLAPPHWCRRPARSSRRRRSRSSGRAPALDRT